MRARRQRNRSLRSPLRTFALGGLLGAAGTVATVRRLRRSDPHELAGLAAFEDAPCFVEFARSRAAAPAGAEAAGADANGEEQPG
jgi:hypothetical protein